MRGATRARRPGRAATRPSARRSGREGSARHTRGVGLDTVRRLAREGVDAETADLFVHAALAESGGGDGARSAAERFLYRYLDGLPATHGLFALNGLLDIPFGPNPNMEVDLLCRAKRLAVEIDGAFHFESADCYRRDRRKDFLLQKNGYLVLRFLAEDVTRRLAHVVGEIAAALESRG